MGCYRSIVLDAPDHKAAHDKIDHHKRPSCKIDGGRIEIDAHAQPAAENCRRNPDPVPAERGSKKHRWKIRGEEHVRPDVGKTPTRRGRHSEARCRKSDAKKRRRFGYSLPGPP